MNYRAIGGVVMLLTSLAGCACAPQHIATMPAETSRDGPETKSQPFVIVHGAFGGGWTFKEVARRLAADGYTVYRPTLTGQGERVHLASTMISLSTHVDDVVNTILYEDLHDVILVGHSYAGMVITEVVDRVPDRIARVIYLDAMLPEEGENLIALRTKSATRPSTQPRPVIDGYMIPTWVKPDQPLPHDVPMSERTFKEPLHLANPARAAAVPAVYILSVDAGKRPEDDDFYYSYKRAQARGWPAWIIEGDHNVQRSHPAEVVRMLERAAVEPIPQAATAR